MLNAFKKFGNWLRALSAVARWRIVFGLAALGAILFLVLAAKPWIVEEGIAGKWRTRHFVAAYSWWATLANVGILGLLAWLCPWWVEKSASAPVRSLPPPVRSRWFHALTVAAMLASVFFGLQRINYSLWDDEEYTVRRAVLGEYETDKRTGEKKLDEISWQETFYNYKKPNNHVLHSVLARTSLTIWRLVAGSDERPFSEFAIRLPAFVFGVCAVGFAALFLNLLGFPSAGVAAAWLIALNPWHVRYASEARGYGMAMCLLVVIWICWTLAVTRGSWRWWWAYAAAQFAVVYTYPATVHSLILLNLATVPVLWKSSFSSGPFRVQCGRWFCVNTVAAAAAIQMMLPLVPQVRAYMAEGEGAREFASLRWGVDVASSFFSGFGWHTSDSAVHQQLSVTAQNFPVLFPILGGAAALFLLAGILRLACGNAVTAALVLAMAGGPLATVAHSLAQGMWMFTFYTVFALPGLAMLIALGGTSVVSVAPIPKLRIAVGAILVFAYAWITQDSRHWLTANPIHSLKESVVLTDQLLADRGLTRNEVVVIAYSGPPSMYDPHVEEPENAGEFIDMLHRADREGRTLLLNTGHEQFAWYISPQMLRLNLDPRLFEPLVTLPGYDPPMDRTIYLYRRGSASGFDFSHVDRGQR